MAHSAMDAPRPTCSFCVVDAPGLENIGTTKPMTAASMAMLANSVDVGNKAAGIAVYLDQGLVYYTQM